MSAGFYDDDLHQQVLQTTLEQISSQSHDGAAECCVICLSNIDEPCEAQPCGHRNFDFLCLVTWLEWRPNCPLCKSVIRQVSSEFADAGKKTKVYTVPELCQEGKASTGPTQTSEHRRNGSSNFNQGPQLLFDDEVTRRRRFIYRHNLYSLHIGSNRRKSPGAKYRELLPQHFITDPELVSRARTWIARELRVFEFLYENRRIPSRTAPRSSSAEYLLEYIIAILKSMDTQGSTGQAENMVQEFLGRDYARLFLHELRAWLRSPFKSLSDWDHAVQYPERSVSSQMAHR